jgi:hypothetical protein
MYLLSKLHEIFSKYVNFTFCIVTVRKQFG